MPLEQCYSGGQVYTVSAIAGLELQVQPELQEPRQVALHRIQAVEVRVRHVNRLDAGKPRVVHRVDGLEMELRLQALVDGEDLRDGCVPVLVAGNADIGEEEREGAAPNGRGIRTIAEPPE